MEDIFYVQLCKLYFSIQFQKLERYLKLLNSS